MVKDTLLKAAKLIEEEGWLQNEEYDGYSYCMIGAIRASADNRDVEWEARQAVRAVLAKRGDVVYEELYSSGKYVTLSSWNDAPDRTKEDVLQVLRDAAEGVEHEAE